MIKLDDVILGMESEIEDIHSYYNTKKDEIVSINFTHVQKYDNEGLKEYSMMCADWEKAEIMEAVYFCEHEDEYIALPSSFDIHEHQMMVDFAQTLSNAQIGNVLLNKLYNKGAFRNFKDALIHYGVEEAWYKYRDKRFCKIAKTWCEKYGIIYEEEKV